MLVPLLLFDHWLGSLFYKEVNPNLGLPDKLKSITAEQYETVRSRILDFRAAALNEQNAELIMTGSDINSLYRESYHEYSQLPGKEKVMRTPICYDIQNNQIIQETIYFYLYFFPNKFFYNKFAINLYLENGIIKETQKTIMIFNQEIFNSSHNPIKPSLASNLIYFLLRAQHRINLPTEFLLEEKEIAEQQIVKEIVKKLKSIEVKDNKLILKV